ncbi:MAG: hypothetical protein KKD05_05160 [Candidatus Omnitrophica bacterium]|nr:hypothetical protein [Candidatus Omnitrophota bacterium]
MDLKKILDDLGCERNIFHNEADFQLTLLRKIISQYDANRLCLEYGKKDVHLDIVINNKKEEPNIGIELKYATIAKQIEEEVCGQNEVFRLKDHKGHTYKRYGFWIDVRRLQDFVNIHSDRVGFVVFLSNDSTYWSRSGQGTSSLIDNREINEGEVISFSYNKKQYNIKCNNSYKLKWRDYGILGFKYLLLKVL